MEGTTFNPAIFMMNHSDQSDTGNNVGMIIDYREFESRTHNTVFVLVVETN